MPLHILLAGDQTGIHIDPDIHQIQLFALRVEPRQVLVQALPDQLKLKPPIRIGWRIFK